MYRRVSILQVCGSSQWNMVVGKYKGTLPVAVAQDDTNKILPIAFSIFKSE